MSAINKAQQAATLVRALTSQQIELRGGTNAKTVQTYRVEFNNEGPSGSSPSGNSSRHDRALIAQQGSWAAEFGTTSPGL